MNNKALNRAMMAGEIAADADDEHFHRHQSEFADPNLGLDLLTGADLTNPKWRPKLHPGVDMELGQLIETRTELVRRLTALILQTGSFEDLLREALQAIATSVGATVSTILELDRTNEEFFFRVSTGGDASLLASVRIPRTGGIAGYVATKGEVELISNANEDERHMHAISRLTGVELHNCIAAPIHVAGELFGILEVFNSLRPEAFTDREKETIELCLPLLGKILEVRFFAAEVLK